MKRIGNIWEWPVESQCIDGSKSTFLQACKSTYKMWFEKEILANTFCFSWFIRVKVQGLKHMVHKMGAFFEIENIYSLGPRQNPVRCYTMKSRMVKQEQVATGLLERHSTERGPGEWQGPGMSQSLHLSMKSFCLNKRSFSGLRYLDHFLNKAECS